MESRESSSPIVTKAVAASLNQEYFSGYQFHWFERLGLRLLGLLPKSVAAWAIPQVQRSSGLEPEIASRVTVAELIHNRLGDYESLRGQFPGVVIGVAQGGAAAHLARLVGGPFLPQAFVLTLKGGSPKGDPLMYFTQSANLAQKITEQNPEFMSIQHFDPVHDGWLTRRVNHLRLKLIQLPQAYRQFIHERVVPGGEVVYLDGGATWLRQPVGPRNYYQAGGWGALSPESFYYGSDRVREYCRREGLIDTGWRLPGYEVESGPESEWGSEPGLREAVQEFCAQEGYHFYPIQFKDPNQFSQLAFLAYQAFYAAQGVAPTGAVIEMFSQFDVTAVHAGKLLPIWLIFNTEDSLAFLRKMLPQVPADLPVFFSALSTFSMTPDLVPWGEWEAALGKRKWINAGARPSHYPADAAAVLDWFKPLRDWSRQQTEYTQGRLSGAQLVEMANAIRGDSYYFASNSLDKASSK